MQQKSCDQWQREDSKLVLLPMPKYLITAHLLCYLVALFRVVSHIVDLKGKGFKLGCGQQIKKCHLKISCTPLRLACMLYNSK